jgi:hypothetical protein
MQQMLGIQPPQDPLLYLDRLVGAKPQVVAQPLTSSLLA